MAAATLAPSTLSLLRNMFLDPAQRTFPVGVWIMSFSVEAVIGPLVGGLLLEHFWWGSVFLIAVPTQPRRFARVCWRRRSFWPTLPEVLRMAVG
jgi:MFS family permease